ncbi:flagellar export protein FliJ [Bdellovibrionota bacterium FG-1]
MAKFHFRLATVLEVRKRREQDTLIALGAAQRAYQQSIADKISIEKELELALIRREKLGTDAVPALLFRVEQDFITGTKQRIIRAEQGIIRANRGVEKALRVYIFARKQTRMIEVLEEKDRREYRLRQARKEQKEMEELIVMRARLTAREAVK